MYQLISGSTAVVRDAINALLTDPAIAGVHDIVYIGSDASGNVHCLVKTTNRPT